MKITILVENTASSKICLPLLGQHGLSLLLDIPSSGRILFDTGQSDILMKNMLLLDVKPNSIDYAILSHGHIDHCGGLLDLLRARSMPLTVFAGPGIFLPRYFQSFNEQISYIGIPHTKDILISSGADFIFSYGPSQIRKNVWLSGLVAKQTDFETEDLRMLDSNKQTDRFADEISFYYVNENGLTVITGCAHRGLVNIIKHGQKITGVEKVHAVIGGSYLEFVSDWQREATMAFLKQINPNIIALSHCTGVHFQGLMKEIFKEKFFSANTGDVIEV